jgi:hypothetical protein
MADKKVSMYKTDDAWQIETADLIELSNRAYCTWNSKILYAARYRVSEPTRQVTPELLDQRYHNLPALWSGGGPYQPYYQCCNAEVLNGDYQMSQQVGNEFTLTRTSIDEPVMVMKLTI